MLETRTLLDRTIASNARRFADACRVAENFEAENEQLQIENRKLRALLAEFNVLFGEEIDAVLAVITPVTA